MQWYAPLSRRFKIVLASFLQSGGLPFADVLREERIARVFAEGDADFAQDPDCVYTPAVTLWAFLSQALAKGELRSCMMAVSRVTVLLVAMGREPCSKNTGAYCRARAKIPEAVIERLALEMAAGCEEAVPKPWLCHGRHVLLVDGTTSNMADTEPNDAEYPKAREEGFGFPIVRLVVFLSLATGMLCGMKLAPYSGKETGETALFRQMLDSVDPQTILLADRYYCSYFLIALALLGRRDFVTRLHQRRKIDFHRAERLSTGDWLVDLFRPQRPEWMDPEMYRQIPESIQLRLVVVLVSEPGFRTRVLTVVTTLTDPEEYPKEEIASLYRQRWLAELDIRSINASLGMDFLRAKSPEMVRREMWACLLAYNAIRKTILQSAHEAGLSPRELSFTTAMQTIAASLETLAVEVVRFHTQFVNALIQAQLASMADQTVGDRPNRVEPRAVKPRRKKYARLTKPRDQARAELLHPIAK